MFFSRLRPNHAAGATGLPFPFLALRRGAQLPTLPKTGPWSSAPSGPRAPRPAPPPLRRRRGLAVPFEPARLLPLATNGRLYHPAPERAGVGLVRSALAFELSACFEEYAPGAPSCPRTCVGRAAVSHSPWTWPRSCLLPRRPEPRASIRWHPQRPGPPRCARATRRARRPSACAARCAAAPPHRRCPRWRRGPSPDAGRGGVSGALLLHTPRPGAFSSCGLPRARDGGSGRPGGRRGGSSARARAAPVPPRRVLLCGPGFGGEPRGSVQVRGRPAQGQRAWGGIRGPILALSLSTTEKGVRPNGDRALP